VYSGAEKVRLYLNDKLIGEAPTGPSQQFKALFTVPYAPGNLRVEGARGGHLVAGTTLTTVGDATSLRLTPDRSTINSDRQDLSFVTVEAIDAAGHYQPTAEQQVEFTITGPGVIAGIGNGDTKDVEPYQANHRALFNGRALVIIRSSGDQGMIKLTAKAVGMGETGVSVSAQPAHANNIGAPK
ncbi:MAG: DUF4982 domain-containing protein, partial [Bryobacteraceae bacterium]